MAAYFQLLNKSTGEAVSFNKLDEDICNHFGWPITDEYVYGWYNAIGMRVAVNGMTLEEVKTRFQEYIDKNDHAEYYTTLNNIIDFIAKTYTTESWHARG